MGLPIFNSKVWFFLEWVKWISTLYWHCTFEIKVNGEIGEAFNLHRSMRQGCPLVPYLFILATNVLRYMLQDPRVEVEGLIVPEGRILKDHFC